ncbi:FmdB family zinc ribbon protein [Saccharomonospora sp. CUA-673]
MPTYQYACKQCSHQFEVVQSFSDDSLTECPECQASCASSTARWA